jgi:murein L,D-transpeptidase YafK
MVESLFPVALLLGASPAFVERQQSAPRVIEARQEKTAAIEKLFADGRVPYPPPRLYLRAFKHEAELELWAAGRTGPMAHLKTYPICAASGELGPKRSRGDLQVPEGFYVVDRFNPWSNFHLSFGINYPNDSDRVRGDKRHLGGDIFIHGDCVTIGCLPIETEPIKELYVIALDTFIARGAGIPVHIFPRRLDDAGMRALTEYAAGDATLVSFWAGLRPAYLYFEEHKELPRIRVDRKTGAYRVGPAP